MINLLPAQTKQNILYARRNSQLLRWIVALVVVIVGILAIVLAGLIYMNSTIESYHSQIEQAEKQLEMQQIDETQARVKEMSDNLRLAVQVLSRQVQFSALLQKIGAIMPPGTVLTGLSIDQIEGGIDLTAAATSYEAGTQVQANLEDPNNGIFSKSDLINVQCLTGPNADPQYPCRATLRALFGENSQFKLIPNDEANNE